MKYIVKYSVPHHHEVQVGTTANSKQEAIEKVSAAFYDLTLWDNTRGMPLIDNDFYEDSDSGEVFEFEVIGTLDGEVGWPAPSGAVEEQMKDRLGREAAQALVDAYAKGAQDGGSIEWSDLDQAHELALRALGKGPNGWRP